MTAKSLQEHGLIKTCIAISVFLLIATVLILAWQLPEIILAIKS